MIPNWSNVESAGLMLATRGEGGRTLAAIKIDPLYNGKFLASWYHTYARRLHHGMGGPFEDLDQAKRFCEDTIRRLQQIYS
jgi:hypothetical protein